MLPFARHPFAWCVLVAVLVDVGVAAAAAAFVASDPASSLALAAIPATAAITLATGMLLARVVLAPGARPAPTDR
jgi:hypothetical protein